MRGRIYTVIRGTVEYICTVIRGRIYTVIRGRIYTVGWVNLYKKFEIEKYTVCGKLILPKKWKGIF